MLNYVAENTTCRKYIRQKGEIMRITRLQCEEFKYKFGYYPVNMDIFNHVKEKELETLENNKEQFEAERKILRMKKDIAYPYGYAPKCVTSKIGVISNKIRKINNRIEVLKKEASDV